MYKSYSVYQVDVDKVIDKINEAKETIVSVTHSDHQIFIITQAQRTWQMF